MILNVSTPAELTAALAQAAGGAIIRLAAGNYGTFSVRDRSYLSTVRIESADVHNPAHFDGLTVRGSSNIVFADLSLGRALQPTEQPFTTLNTIRDSTDISLVRVQVHGSTDDNPQNDGRGLVVDKVSRLLIQDSSFAELSRALVVTASRNVVVRGSEFETIRSDGINIAAVDGLVITDNSFADFRPIAPDHSDLIQFFNTGQTEGTKNVTIENNRMIINNYNGTEGTGTQGIFIGDPLTFGYENILIRNNVLFSNGAFHGISVDGATKLQILDNTVLSQRGDSRDFWIQVNNSDGIIVDRNVADNFIFQNVTRLFQGDNINLKVFPSLASDVPNLQMPVTPSDLVVPQLGYSEPELVSAGSIADALSTMLLAWSEASPDDGRVSAQAAVTSLSDLSDPLSPVIETQWFSKPPLCPEPFTHFAWA